MADKPWRFFLGEATADGFKTDFLSQIRKEGYFTYILKGGPGTGKSGILKRIVREFSDSDCIELYYCSSDPGSLDAVLLKKAKIIVMDGTSPHTFDPEYPGISQCIINLGEYWSEDILMEKAEEIKSLTDESSAWHKRARRYLTALSSLDTDILEISEKALLSSKLEGFIQRYSKRVFPKKQDKKGEIIFKQLAAITEEGYILKLPEELSMIITVDDPYFSAGDRFLRAIARLAAERGIDAVVSLGRLFGAETYEHVILPELGIGFFSKSFLSDTPLPDRERINMERFYDKPAVTSKKQRIAFDRKAALEMKSEAMYSIRRAKEAHDRLEECYIRAMDFDKINSAGDKIIRQIEKRYH